MGKSKKKNSGGGGKMRASHILTEKHKIILQVMNMIKNGEDFRKLAHEFSTCPSKKKGGDLGWFTRGKMVPQFENAVLTLKIGEISEPVKTQFGWHLIKRTG
ncbi:MAG: peptidylprolyl isomerase [Promethearchaeota archaeon]